MAFNPLPVALLTPPRSLEEIYVEAYAAVEFSLRSLKIVIRRLRR